MKQFLLILLVFCHPIIYSQTASLDSLKSWMRYLASDELKGRANGSAENVKIADWLNSKFEIFGIEPLDGSSWRFQDYYYPDLWATPTNIIGYIQGKSEDSYIILSAHYDHIGLSHSTKSREDVVFNGADDDASGICMLLGIAMRIQADTNLPECSIIIAAFSGEELGRLGSKAFCESNLIDWRKVKLNLNFELTGRSSELGRKKYYLTGPSQSNLTSILKEYNKESTWRIFDDNPFYEDLYYLSDNYSFVEKIQRNKLSFPAHTLATSIGTDYVHTVKDEEKFIDYENLNDLADYITTLIYYLSQKEVILSVLHKGDN